MGKMIIVHGANYLTSVFKPITITQTTNRDFYPNAAYLTTGTRWEDGAWLSTEPIKIVSGMCIHGTSIGYDGKAVGSQLSVQIFPIVFLDDLKNFLSSPELPKTGSSAGVGNHYEYNCEGAEIPENAVYIVILAFFKLDTDHTSTPNFGLRGTLSINKC